MRTPTGVILDPGFNPVFKSVILEAEKLFHFHLHLHLHFILIGR
jgi:hypothetical protein